MKIIKRVCMLILTLVTVATAGFFMIYATEVFLALSGYELNLFLGPRDKPLLGLLAIGSIGGIICYLLASLFCFTELNLNQKKKH